MLNVHEPLVYYVLRDGIIKIGTTTNYRNRVPRLKPDRVLAVEPGSYDLEAARHAQFAADHIPGQGRPARPGEWFRPGASLLAHIDTLCLIHPVPDLPKPRDRDWVPGQHDGERWLPVVGWEDVYAVSDLARVLRLLRNGQPGHLLKPFVNGQYGYLAVKLCHNGVQVNGYLHRLVTTAFLGPLPEGMETRHGRGGKLDNRLVNLSYGTKDENGQDKVRDGTSRPGSQSYHAKLTEADVEDIRRRLASGERQRCIAEHYGISQPAVNAIANGRTWRHIELLPTDPASKMARRANGSDHPHDLIVALYARWVAGETVPQLAAEIGMKPVTLGGRFYALEKLPGHVVDRPNRLIHKLTPELTAELHRRYLDGENVADLAAEIGMEKSSIRVAFRRSGLPVRPGSKAPVRLTETDVVEIRRRVAAGEMQRTVAREYDLSEGAVSNIIARRSWRNC